MRRRLGSGLVAAVLRAGDAPLDCRVDLVLGDKLGPLFDLRAPHLPRPLPEVAVVVVVTMVLVFAADVVVVDIRAILARCSISCSLSSAISCVLAFVFCEALSGRSSSSNSGSLASTFMNFNKGSSVEERVSTDLLRLFWGDSTRGTGIFPRPAPLPLPRAAGGLFKYSEGKTQTQRGDHTA
uniref:Uncharacterized protein n=1 Tax=Glossina pallidipes TaxID=7398 RepID=A0A1A9ZKR3_GLOPL